MLVCIGSKALAIHGILSMQQVKNSDWDFICSTEYEWNHFRDLMKGEEIQVQNPDVRAFKCTLGDVTQYYEAYIAKPDSSDQMILDYVKNHVSLNPLARDVFGVSFADPEVCLAIKMSHRYKKDSSFFMKTMQTIRMLRNLGYKLNDELNEIMLKRQKEVLSYNHPNLNVTKDKFFDDTIYTLDHDSIHRAVALFDRPAYTYYMKDGSEVMTCKDKFFALPYELQLAGVYEETCVLALERSQVPFDFVPTSTQSFMHALEKVCTSITSGWFREFAWENYFSVVAMHRKLGVNDYVKRFKDNIDLIEPFKKGN
ncbi:hypothetical protein KNT64_gp027 [Pseudomonas phage PspYZU05]|uniref:Uncharacterized protein n=1 Tax=Pseudomonas phage PspYZU05 TaxID=1983556 RepID=A0A2U7NBN8_9CAUD|nr:hypothetical protein KNT64_gp027 [Pseudomonas phage PspYZU05]ASD51979.1 hypothetical protein PspYZU05_27 [Pseudomonas phage PspYZU05]